MWDGKGKRRGKAWRRAPESLMRVGGPSDLVSMFDKASAADAGGGGGDPGGEGGRGEEHWADPEVTTAATDAGCPRW